MTLSILIGLFIAGILVCVLIVKVFFSGRFESLKMSFDRDRAVYEERLNSYVQKEHDSRKILEDNLRLTGENARLSALLEKEKQTAAEKLELLNKSRIQMKEEFENLSNRIFKEKNEESIKLNEKSLDSILSQFKGEIKDFKEKVDKVYNDESKERHTLKSEIERLAKLSDETRLTADNLTNVLRGDKKQQGCWGEFILESVLEESGLRNGHEYDIQVSSRNEEGEKQQPDVVVHLPDGKAVIIDSKVTLNSYEEYVSVQAPELKESSLKSFTANVRNHIRELGSKSYERLYGIRSPDYVLMFIPIESAFITVLEAKKELFSEAFKEKIVLVSPATLLVVLKTIKSIWQVRQQEMNAEEIAKKAAKLYDKLVDFTENFRKVGKKIHDAEETYNEALGQLCTGKGNIVSRTEYFKKLGISPKKDLRDVVPDIDEEELEKLN